jgi:hypothetical protein
MTVKVGGKGGGTCKHESTQPLSPAAESICVIFLSNLPDARALTLHLLHNNTLFLPRKPMDGDVLMTNITKLK